MRDFADYIGNREAVTRIKILAEASKRQSERLAHIGLFGQPGNGKTSLAKVTAGHIGAEFVYINSVAVETPLQFRKIILDRLGSTVPTIIMLDECHQLPRSIQDNLLSVLEEPAVLVTRYGDDFLRDALPKMMSFMLATTHRGMLQDALLSRLEQIDVREYTLEEKAEIAARHLIVRKRISRESMDPRTIVEIARRSRNIRALIQNCNNVLNYATIVKGSGRINTEAVDGAFRLQGIDINGLNENDRMLLGYLKEAGHAGLDTLEAVLGITKEEIKDKIEPHLLRNGFIVRRSAGRVITDKGRKAAEGARVDVY